MDQRTFEKKVQELAEKLKQSGVVTSDSMAKGMATDILRTELSMKEKYQPEKSSSENNTSSGDEQESSSPKNLIVEEAIAKAQGTPHQARVGADIDQSKSIAELLDEDASQQEEAKITLETPVVEGGVAKQSVSATVNKSPLEVYEEEVRSEDSVDEQEGADEPTQEDKIVEEEPVKEEKRPQEEHHTKQETQEEDTSQEERVEEKSSEENSEKQSQEESSESKQEAPTASKEESRPTVDLSEMFNFSKK